jgi:hypothetical protein
MKGARIDWSAEELAWIEANRTMFRVDAHRDFCARFNRPEITFGAYASLCKRSGWMTGRIKGNGTRGRSHRYSPAEIAWMGENRTLPCREAHALFCAAFSRADVSEENFHALRVRRGLKTGRTGRIEKGNVPANKGMKMPFNANSAKTQFKQGNVPHTMKFEGHEHITKDGYVEISVAEVNPHTGFERRYVQKHRWLWEKLNGPVPEGMALKCLDGDRKNTDPSNWECIPRAMLPRLNGIHGRGYDAAQAELKPVILAVTKLEHRARSVLRDAARAAPQDEGVSTCAGL